MAWVQCAMAKTRLGIISTTATIVLAGTIGLFFYQLHLAERGRPYHLPHFLRHLLAARSVQKAAGAQYELDRLGLYTRAAVLDPHHFPESWKYLCKHSVQWREWQHAVGICRWVVNLEGPTAENETTLGQVYQNLRAYSAAADAYATAAKLTPHDPEPYERALWMFLASGRYEEATSMAAHIIEDEPSSSRKVSNENAHVALGFASSQLGDIQAAIDAYAIGFPDLRATTCSLEHYQDWGLALVCSGVSRMTGRESHWCMGNGCGDLLRMRYTNQPVSNHRRTTESRATTPAK